MSDYDDGALWHELDRLRDNVRTLEHEVRNLEQRLETQRYERQDIDQRLARLERGLNTRA